jgi:hypothetical protein
LRISLPNPRRLRADFKMVLKIPYGLIIICWLWRLLVWVCIAIIFGCYRICPDFKPVEDALNVTVRDGIVDLASCILR